MLDEGPLDGGQLNKWRHLFSGLCRNLFSDLFSLLGSGARRYHTICLSMKCPAQSEALVASDGWSIANSLNQCSCSPRGEVVHVRRSIFCFAQAVKVTCACALWTFIKHLPFPYRPIDRGCPPVAPLIELALGKQEVHANAERIQGPVQAQVLLVVIGDLVLDDQQVQIGPSSASPRA